MARRYEFYVLVARTISHSFASLTREILFLPLEHKIHIFSPPCNILYLHATGQMSNPFLSAPLRCFYSVFYLWILFSSYRLKMEISKILMATIVAATLMSQTHSASLQVRVTDVIPQKTANAIQKVSMSYLVRFPRWSPYSQLKVIKLILTEIAI